VAKLARNRRLRAKVEAKLLADWSPEEISGWLAMTYPNDPEMNVSHKTIYQSLFVQGRGALRHELHVCLRSGPCGATSAGSRAATGWARSATWS
jgi:IS30 family transposase